MDDSKANTRARTTARQKTDAAVAVEVPSWVPQHLFTTIALARLNMVKERAASDCRRLKKTVV